MKYLFYVLIAGVLLSLWSSCKKEDHAINTNVSPVTSFFSPADSAFYDLQNTSSILFEWDAAAAEDGDLVLYTVAFDKPDGDFSSPIYTIASDGNGLYNRATLDKSTLNKIAKLAGLNPSESGKLKWTVFSSKGVNKVKASIARIVEIQRPFGLDVIPSNLYITGSATEGGDDITKAIKLKQTGDGTFEIYTSLKAGTYHFIDKTAGADINAYYTDGGTVKEGDDEVTVTGDAKVYRIDLDLTLLTTTKTWIKGIDFWYCSKSAFQGSFTYKSNGVWEMDNYTVIPTDMGGWTDTRYKFRVSINDGTSDGEEWWGNSDHEGGNAPTASSPESFYYLYAADNSQWNYGFKFADAATNKKVDIQLIFSPSVSNYTHSVTIH